MFRFDHYWALVPVLALTLCGSLASCGSSDREDQNGQCTAVGQRTCTSDDRSVLECKASQSDPKRLTWAIAETCQEGPCSDGLCPEFHDVLQTDIGESQDSSLGVDVAVELDSSAHPDAVVTLDPPTDEQPLDFAGLSISTLLYSGRVQLPANSAASMHDIVVKGALGEADMEPDGRFRLRMNEQATALLIAELDGVPFLMSVFPKHPDLIQINPLLSPRSTALALVALMPGVLTGDERLDALLLAELESRPEFEPLAALVATQLAADTSAIAAPDAQLVSALRTFVLSLELPSENDALPFKSGTLDPCYSPDWPGTDEVSFAFYDLDGRNEDGLYIQATFNDAMDRVTLRITNGAPRWVSLIFNAGLSDEQWVGLVPPRKVEVPGVSKLLKDLLKSVGSTAWNQAFGEGDETFWTELRDSLDAAYLSHFDCKHTELEDLPFLFEAGATLDAFTFGSTPLPTDAYIPAGLTITTQAILPLLALYIDISASAGAEVFEDLSVQELSELYVGMEVLSGPITKLITAVANSDMDLEVVFQALSDVVEKACTSSSFWESVRWILKLSSTSVVSEGLENVQSIWKELLSPFKWFDAGMTVISTAYAMAYLLDTVRDFDSTDQYKLDPCRPDPYEDNDIEALATDVTLNNGMAVLETPEICPGDVDWFWVNGAGIEGLSCTVTVLADYVVSAAGLHGELSVELLAFDEALGSVQGEGGYAQVAHVFDKASYLAIRVQGAYPAVRNAYRLTISQTCSNPTLCGNGTCDDGETQDSCPADCTECIPDCAGKECGPDGCGSNCGGCGAGEVCNQTLGQCEADSCWPDCGDEVLIPAGTFWMGCNEAVDDDCDSNEYPYHEVYLDAYYIDRTEVTVDAYSACVSAGACTAASTSSSYCNWGVAGKGSHPVNCVTWYQVDEFCAWAGKRLPTEAEWEKAARGTDGRKYPWGNATATCDYAVMDDGGNGCGTGSTWPVCSKSPVGDSPYGLCDMAGNVWEWVADWYDSGYYQSSPANNPQGPNSGSYRVDRGGSFYNYDDYLRASSRGYGFPSYSDGRLGFRCSRSE